MPETNLEDLKSLWKNQPIAEKYGNQQILEMLNRKSRHYVKYIFWISAAEFVIFLLWGLWHVFEDDSTSSFYNVLERLGVKQTQEIRMNFEHLYFLMKVISLMVSGYFVVKFYRNYRKISVEENLKQFIIQIICFCRTVKTFIVVNLLMMLLFMAVLAAFTFNSVSAQNINLTSAERTAFFTATGFSTAIALVMIWLYYRIVYGALVRKLEHNLAQLREMEKG